MPSAAISLILATWPGGGRGLKFPQDAAERATEVHTALAAVALFFERAVSIVVGLIVPTDSGRMAAYHHGCR